MCKAASGLCFFWDVVPAFSWRVTKTAKDLRRIDVSNRETSECVLGTLPLEVTSRTEFAVILLGSWPRKENSPTRWTVVLECFWHDHRPTFKVTAAQPCAEVTMLQWMLLGKINALGADECVSSRAASSSLPQSNALRILCTRFTIEYLCMPFVGDGVKRRSRHVVP
jgi:hypothetical protein